MKKIIIFGLILFLSFNTIYSAKWQQFKTIEGKDITAINAIAVDSSNRLMFFSLIAPFSYLVIWDGNNFKKINLSDFFGGTSFYMRNFHIVDNILWGTSEFGFMNYFIDKDSVAFFNRKQIKGDWDYDNLTGLVVDRDRNIWFTTRGGTLAKFDGKDFLDFYLEYNNILRFPWTNCPLAVDEDSNIWVAGTDGVLRFSTKSTADSLIYKKYSNNDILLNAFAESLIYNEIDRTIWCANRDVSYFDGEKWNLVVIPDSIRPKVVNQGGDSCSITGILIDKNNNKYLFWDFGTNYFLILGSNNQFTKVTFPDGFSPYNSIDVLSAIFDRNNNLWIGTSQSGLIKYSQEPSVVDEDQSKLPDIYVRNIYPNPTRGILTIDMLVYPENLHDLKVFIVNLLGAKIKDITKNVVVDYSSGNAWCFADMEDMEQGMYLLCLQKGKNKIVRLISKID